MVHNEKLHSLYRSSNIFKRIKLIRLRWADHVARVEKGRNAFKILTGNTNRKETSRKT